MIEYVHDRQVFNNLRRFTSGAVRPSVLVGKIPYSMGHTHMMPEFGGNDKLWNLILFHSF